jgi:hypothetical protein
LTFVPFRCEDCKKVSVISHSYYLLLAKEEDKLPEDQLLSPSAYYTKMCISAEMWIAMARVSRNLVDE